MTASLSAFSNLALGQPSGLPLCNGLMSTTLRGVEDQLDLPRRQSKPRRSGISVVIDPGAATGLFEDVIDSHAPLIDFVKFGWGTALVTRELERKIMCLRRNHIEFFFGGTLFEKFVLQGRFEGFRSLCHQHGCRWVEVSNGTIPMSAIEKSAFVAALRGDFDVVSEVGFKDAARSGELAPADWVASIRADLDAGASLVLTEARESGRAGICTPDGRPRQEVVDAVLGSGLDVRRLVFEAPTNELQTYFVRRLGPNVNLGNVAMADVVGLETLRLGLRADTLLEGPPLA
jgi:phosphosulfolactate synthase